MKQRLKMSKVYPEAYKAMDALDKINANAQIDKWHKEMIRIRASHINGCAYCVHYHTQDALKLGIDFNKINLVNVWKEAKNVFNEQEQLLLKMTEELTLINQHGLSDETYESCIQLFGEEQTAQVFMQIITINAWNRIGVGLNMEPEMQAV